MGVTPIGFDGAVGSPIIRFETRGVLAGIKYANVMIDSAVLKVGTSTIGYLGGYHQSWRFSADKPFTLPILRFDLDRLTDEEQIRFGITAEVAWAPNPSFQLTLRSPITLR